jgi:hypothetical protein
VAGITLTNAGNSLGLIGLIAGDDVTINNGDAPAFAVMSTA